MIKHIHSLICGRSIVDRNTGLSSYIDVIEAIVLKKAEKILLPRFTLISRYGVKDGIADNQELEVEVSRKKSGASKRIKLQSMSFPLTEKGESILVQLDVMGLILENDGLWEFDVRWKLKDSGKWKKGTSIPLKVSILD